MNEEGQSLRELVGTGLPYKFGEPETKRALHILKDVEKRKKEEQIRQRIRDGTIVRRKAVVFLINCTYSPQSGFESLEGPANDLDIAKQMFEGKGYKIHILEDKESIEDSINNLIDENETEFKELDVLQFIYSGKCRWTLNLI